MTSPARRGQFRRMTIRAATASMLIATITIGSAYVRHRELPPGFTAHGTVECLGASVVGIWISAPYGDAGEPSRTADAARPSRVTFTHDIRHGGPYILNVGCGGTPYTWGVGATSLAYTRDEIHLICNSDPSMLGRLSHWLPLNTERPLPRRCVDAHDPTWPASSR